MIAILKDEKKFWGVLTLIKYNAKIQIRWSKYDPFYKTLFWKKLKKDVMKRDDYQCTECGAPGHITHHIVPRSKGGAHVLENLTTLCEHCHKKHHPWIE